MRSTSVHKPHPLWACETKAHTSPCSLILFITEKYKKAGEGTGEKARLTVDSHGPSKQSGSLGFGPTTFSQTKP